MSWKKKEPAKEREVKKPTFTVMQFKDGYYARIGGGLLKQGKSYGSLAIFPSKFEGQFAAFAIGGLRGNFLPMNEDNIDIKGNTLILDFGWLKIEATGENIQELADWLSEYVPTVEKTAGQKAEEPEQPQKKGWKK